MSQPLKTASGGGAARAAEDPLEIAYLTVKEVAAILRVSVRHVHNLAHAGELDYIMPGKLMRISEPSLRAFMKRSAA